MNKYKVDYFRCTSCYFVQTTEPFWLQEAYTSAITSLDIGLIGRNLYLKERVSAIIDACFPESRDMIDYGGGYGMFVRLMRDLGYNFYRQDIYCENLFAAFFDLKDAPRTRFDLLTAFEVFEHLVNPPEEIEKMFRLSDTLIFTTSLPPRDIKTFENWWYVSPLTGQHIAFYDLKTLEYLAKRFNCRLYSNKVNLHILTALQLDNGKISSLLADPTPASLWERLKRRLPGGKAAAQRASLLEADYKYIEQKLTQTP